MPLLERQYKEARTGGRCARLGQHWSSLHGTFAMRSATPLTGGRAHARCGWTVKGCGRAGSAPILRARGQCAQ